MDRFDKELRSKLGIELGDIRLSDEALIRIKEQIKLEKRPGSRDTLANLLNYEFRIPYSTCIAVVALAAFVSISAFTVTDKDVASFTDKNIIEVSGYWEGVR